MIKKRTDPNHKSGGNQKRRINQMKIIALFIPVLLVLSMGVQSSFGHNAGNIADAMSVNTNSNGALQRVKECLTIQSTNEQSPLSRKINTHFNKEKPKNLVVFLQERLGPQFVETLGGKKGVTPNLNRLSREGILFKNVFSKTTKSNSGTPGPVSGTCSTPGKGVLKRNGSQKENVTIASLLKPFGYHTMFLYGGDSGFKNMKNWFSDNGFDRTIHEPKFKNTEFKGSLEGSNGNLISRANQEFTKQYNTNQPFAAVMYSTSNQSPFNDLTDGTPEKSVINAARHADIAIGDFIKKAKKEPYYKDTVFVIIADHNVKIYGDDMGPVNRFNVPVLLLGDGIEPLKYHSLATQPDVLATALDLMGLDFNDPLMGQSILSGKEQHLKAAAHEIKPEKDTLAFVLSLAYYL
jgi:phosphoglycerol transferase MdoB-like AlkP superfamily enzyme